MRKDGIGRRMRRKEDNNDEMNGFITLRNCFI